jgi:tetratricopeptide (TPR) repeat protein
MNPDLVASLLSPAAVTPQALDALYALGHQLLVQQDSPRAALPVFRVMLACAPTDERAWLGVGECHLRLDETGVALEILGAATVASRGSARCHVARARLLLADGRRRDADDAFDEALAIAEASADDELVAIVARERRSS